MTAQRCGCAGWGVASALTALLLTSVSSNAGEAPGAAGGGRCADERVVDLGGGVKMALVLIPAGSFTMGSTEAEMKAVLAKWPEVKDDWLHDGKPAAHKVTISKAFWMGKHEVTVGQFRRFVEATGYKTDAEKSTGYGGTSWRTCYKQTDEHPVIFVSWNDARAFADWLNATDKAKPAGTTYRLPTEAEWEYACRAGTATWYQWGDDPDAGTGWCNAADLTAKKGRPDLKVFNWDDGFSYTAPVGSFRANAFGLHDMHGNVSEWCQDWYGAYTEGDQTDPAGPATGLLRVVRGGSWNDGPGGLRSACRLWWSHPGGPCNSSCGFRVVLAACGPPSWRQPGLAFVVPVLLLVLAIVFALLRCRSQRRRARARESRQSESP